MYNTNSLGIAFDVLSFSSGNSLKRFIIISSNTQLTTWSQTVNWLNDASFVF